MIECVNGNGQGCCDLCLILHGWHREWSSNLYYVRNKNGLYLRRKSAYGYIFSSDVEYSKAVFCYAHALDVEKERMLQNDWDISM